MIKLQNVLISVNNTGDEKIIVSETLKIDVKQIKSVNLFKRAIDARKKPNIFYCNTYIVDFFDSGNEKNILKKNKNALPYVHKPYIWRTTSHIPKARPVVIGSGPAGMFAALTLARAGLNPIIIEKGEPVEKRVKTVETFWNGNEINSNSNVQFGEGGAGTFSDGKLNTGIKDARCRTVLEEFHRFGANEDILFNAKPHIGTDVLRRVVKNIRNEILSLGGEYRFNTEFKRPIIKNNRLNSIILSESNTEYEIPTEHLILAIGNAARNTYYSLYNSGIDIIPKAFAMGVRIEHLQENINRARYGNNYPKILPPADYKLATHLENRRGVYSFCMCPGGLVVNSSSEPNTHVTNGMSNQKRNEKNANSALLVGISEDDFSYLGDGTPFGGIKLQEQIEKTAFNITKGLGVPTQTVGSFLGKSKKNAVGDVLPTVKPLPCFCDISEIFPSYITDSLKLAIPIFDKQIKGFSNENAILTAPETRSSAPVRIIRDKAYRSNITGIYPCGEGAGYAGGITSSAVDGIRVAEAIIESLEI